MILFPRFGVSAFTSSLVERGLVVESSVVEGADVAGEEVEEEVAVGGGYEAKLLLHTVTWPQA